MLTLNGGGLATPLRCAEPLEDGRAPDGAGSPDRDQPTRDSGAQTAADATPTITDCYPVSGYAGVTYVIPCGGAKLDHPARAQDLYTGSMFRHTWDNATRSAALDEGAGLGPARVLILSAKYGLVEPDQVLQPYDLRMSEPGSVSVQTIAQQALALGIDWGSQVYALLPRPYLARLDEALRTHDVYPIDVYEAAKGIGEQKRINVHIGRPRLEPTVPDGPGPKVWLGGDVNAMWWGKPLLVSYGRLREANTLPVATASWVCDSRAFSEIDQHGTWTISAREYADNLTLYAQEIGHLTWAAPQDWPCSRTLLDKTGLTEEEHQRRTIASVLELRALAPTVPVICVVTGLTAAGYLRHIELYRAAGIDLRKEKLVVGVGALVGRSPQDSADIVRTLYAAGLHRLHGFGAKSRVLDLVGALLESFDSAEWSGEARRHTGLCPHGLTRWEQNCPRAAQDWGDQQRERAARAHVQEMFPLFDLDDPSPV